MFFLTVIVGMLHNSIGGEGGAGDGVGPAPV